MEKLGRGVVAVHYQQGKVFIGWRLLGTDPEGIAFNIYRKSARSPAVKLNAAPLTTAIASTGFSRVSLISMASDRVW
jgi:rhamnogalacturonan endolyase